MSVVSRPAPTWWKGIRASALAHKPRLWMLLLLAAVSFLIVYPLSMLLVGSFREGSPFQPGAWTASGYSFALHQPGNIRAIKNTLILAVTRTAGAVSLAIFLAWAIHRTDLPWRHVLDKILWFRFFVPPLPIILAWVLLLSPRSGIINQFGYNVLGLDSPIFTIFGFGGIIFTGIISWAIFLYILISPAFMHMDAALEESSRMSGASQWTTLRRVTVPLLAPAILGVVVMAFVRFIESFETELFLGTPAGVYVVSTRIFWMMQEEPTPLYTAAMAMAMMLLTVTVGLVALQWWKLGHRQYVTVTGRGYRPTPMALGRFKYLILGIVLLYLVIDIVVPIGALIYGSFMKIAGLPELGYTLKNWTKALSDPLLLSSLKNTLIMAVGAGLITTVLTFLVSYVVTRVRSLESRALDLVSWLPWAVPGVVAALGFLWAFMYNPLTVPLYGTIWIMMLALSTRTFTASVRVTASSLIQIHKELEESSRISGASWGRTTLRVLVPLLRPAVITAFLMTFALAVRDLNAVIFLYSPNSRVLSTVIYEYWSAGRLEIGLVYGIIQAVLVFAAYLLVRLVGGGARTSM